jgi:hypothetical protein
MRPQKTSPPAENRRPPEPIRPMPAQRVGITLLAVRARRARRRRMDLR